MKRALASILIALVTLAPTAQSQAASRHLGEVYFEEPFEADIPEGHSQTYTSRLLNAAILSGAQRHQGHTHVRLSDHYQRHVAPRPAVFQSILHDKTKANFIQHPPL